MQLLRDARFVAPYDTYLAAKFRAERGSALVSQGACNGYKDYS
jgi:hypothetical protein